MTQATGDWPTLRGRLDAASAAVATTAIVIADLVTAGNTPHANTIEKYWSAKRAKEALLEQLDAMVKADERKAKGQS